MFCILSNSRVARYRHGLLTLLRRQNTANMGEATIVGSKWRQVEVGRVVLIQDDSPYNGRLATIVEIIDHKRVRVAGTPCDRNPGAA